MTQPHEPTSFDVSDVSTPAEAGMTLRRKLVLLAVPTVIAVISIPVGIAHAHGTAQSRIESAPTVHLTQSVTAKTVHAVAPKLAVKAAAEPAETGTDTGHSDEAAGSTSESTVDHQFEGQE